MKKNKETLHLVVEGKWYDMIASGEKKEYREEKPYWIKRLMIPNGVWYAPWAPRYKQFLYVVFHRGYTKTSMTFVIEKIYEGIGKPEWGVPADKEVYIIQLGERIK